MRNNLVGLKLFLIGSVALGIVMGIPDVVGALPSNAVLNENNAEDANALPLAQVTSVSQLSDVTPRDWAFQSLQSLVERYGCIAGSPKQTYRGDRALTRYEFAAALNNCLDKIQELVANTTSDFARKEDLEVLKRLQTEFATELASLRGRVDNLQYHTDKLEAQQFSTTTKLTGEVIFALTGILAGDDGVTRVNSATTDTTPRQNAVFANRVRLNLNTSFSGRDSLKLRLQTGNFNLPGFAIASDGVFQTLEGSQTFNVISNRPNNRACCVNPNPTFSSTNNNSVVLDSLLYSFPIGRSTKVVVAANGGEHADYTPTLNPYFEDFDGGSGALSTFAQRSPIYRMGSEFGSGVGITTKLNRLFSISLGYLANGTGNYPFDKAGLFDGSFSVLGQLTITPSDRFSLGLTYNYTYLTQYINTNFAGITGTKISSANTFVPENTYNNSFGLAASYQVSPSLRINGWVTTTNGRDFSIPKGSSDYYYTWSYALGLAFPDLGKKGNLGGLLVGIEPYLTGFYLNGNRVAFPRSLPFHIEGFYKHQLTDNISLTAGTIWLTSPNQESNNPDTVIGTLRTTFLF
ncbi:iron uptake porin [Aetokthonos hydrillicola]|uniref:iron uptake porin n=1 Tax=Aetokthonos hydrillicola TaxID=1550245 RepID=UPI0030DDAAF1